MLYEIGDPKDYITPDVVADFTSIHVEDVGKNRVKVYGIKGEPYTDSYKVSASYNDGYKLSATLVYSWPDALKKLKKELKYWKESKGSWLESNRIQQRIYWIQWCG